MKLTCDELDVLLPEFLDGTLTQDQEGAAAEHLATCDQCRLQVSELEGVGDLYRRHGKLTLPDDARQRIRNALGVDKE
ncbi:MAG: zf-HC2 domain-containing protein [Actinomycetota bacterium]|nr:zf-HC2 domain-containing protein [Actinomycetota bacterium]